MIKEYWDKQKDIGRLLFTVKQSKNRRELYQEIIKNSGVCWCKLYKEAKEELENIKAENNQLRKKEKEMSELFNKIANDVVLAQGIKTRRSIEIDLTVEDIESVLSKKENVELFFPTNDGEEILIKFVYK